MNRPLHLHLSKVAEHGGSIMKRIIAHIGRASVRASVSASVAAAGVVAVGSVASAENRPGPFETEFDVSPGATPQIASLQVAPTAAKWQASIADYLEGLADEPAPAAEKADPVTVTDVVTAEVKAFAAADEPDPETVPEAKAEAKPEATAETKPDVVSDAKPDV